MVAGEGVDDRSHSGGTFLIGGIRECTSETDVKLSFCSESSSKGVGGSDLKVRDLVEEIVLCVRRSADSLGGFGNGLRCGSDPLGVLVDIETFDSCSESKLSLLSRPYGSCWGE